MLGQLARQMHGLVSAPLRYHHDAADLLHLGVIRWADPVQVSCNLETKGSRTKTILSTIPDSGLSALCSFPSPRTKQSFSKRGQNLLHQSSLGCLFEMLNMALISDLSHQNLKWGPRICIAHTLPNRLNSIHK